MSKKKPTNVPSKKKGQNTFKMLFKIIKPIKWVALLGVICAAISTILYVVGPSILNEMMQVVGSADFNLKTVNTLGLILVAIYLC